MILAAIDTSTQTLSCALAEVEGDSLRIAAERNEPASGGSVRGGHSPRLPDILTELLQAQGRVLEAIDVFAIGIGPGSFTGLRISLATWKGLAYARRRPLIGVSSLAALALAASPDVPEDALLVPLLDARRGELYAGFYRRLPAGGVELVAPEVAISAEALVARVQDPSWSASKCFAFGEGYAAYRQILAPALPPAPSAPATPPAWAVATLAAGPAREATFDPNRVFALEPHYVRASEAEIRFPNGFVPGGAGRAP
jgi:tRNA threonylcarbamoyladenosine biosynthesis protein TsaB